ncbi:hypothetical protein ACTXT7_008199 [Hymenolepis weldensis]
MAAYVKGFASVLYSSAGWIFINGNLQLLRIDIFEHPALSSSLIFQAEVILFETDTFFPLLNRLGENCEMCKNGNESKPSFCGKEAQSKCKFTYLTSSTNIVTTRMCKDLEKIRVIFSKVDELLSNLSKRRQVARHALFPNMAKAILKLDSKNLKILNANVAEVVDQLRV